MGVAQGIEHGWKLPEPCSVDPQHVPGSERLPKSLAEAIHAFEHPPEGSPGALGLRGKAQRARWQKHVIACREPQRLIDIPHASKQMVRQPKQHVLMDECGSHPRCHAGADLRAVLVKHIGAPLVDTYMSVRLKVNTLPLLRQRLHGGRLQVLARQSLLA